MNPYESPAVTEDDPKEDWLDKFNGACGPIYWTFLVPTNAVACVVNGIGAVLSTSTAGFYFSAFSCLFCGFSFLNSLYWKFVEVRSYERNDSQN